MSDPKFFCKGSNARANLARVTGQNLKQRAANGETLTADEKKALARYEANLAATIKASAEHLAKIQAEIDAKNAPLKAKYAAEQAKIEDARKARQDAALALYEAEGKDAVIAKLGANAANWCERQIASRGVQ